MKLALYLPNFRDMVTVKELEDLTSLAEELDFDSVWTLDRIVVPEASDRVELQNSFGLMEEFPKALPVSSRGQWFQGWPLIPWLAAKTSKVRICMSITDTPFRAPGVLAAELATVDHLSNGRLNVGVGAGWMPEEFAASSASHIFPKRHKHVRETIEIMQGIWTNDVFEYHGEFADFDRFVASFVSTFGGTTSKAAIVTVTPAPSLAKSQLVLTPVGVAPGLLGYAGALYGIAAVLAGAAMIALAIRVRSEPRGHTASKQMFGFSILYLFLLFAMLLVDRMAGALFAPLWSHLPTGA